MFGWFRILICSVMVMSSVCAKVEMTWSDLGSFPPEAGMSENKGVARPFYGIHRGVVLVAGGANFPEKPLREGGPKRYHRTIYGLAEGSDRWVVSGRLPEAMGEGVSISTDQGVVCVAGAVGETGEELSDRAFLMTWENGGVHLADLPTFPHRFKMGCGAASGSEIFVACGREVWTLDLKRLPAGWRQMASLPSEREQAVMVVQNSGNRQRGLFVFGGICPETLEAPGDGWFCDLAKKGSGAWVHLRRPESEVCVPMPGAVAMASGDQHILFFGGSDVRVWREYASNRGSPDFLGEYFARPVEAFGFRRSVAAYHTVTDKWFVFGEQPVPGRCGAAVVRRADGSLCVAGGEVAPGIRTPRASSVRFSRAKVFHPVNAAVIAGYLLLLAAMGVWFMRGTKSADDFFRGGGSMPWWAVSISLYAAMFSSITFLSIPALAYGSDWRWFVTMIGVVVLAPVAAKCYLPFFRRLNLTSAYEYLELRFNAGCRLFASLAFICFMVVRIAIVSYLPAVAVSVVTGLNVNLAIVCVSVCTVLYCSAGGIKAVIWSDVVQSAVILSGSVVMLLIMVSGTDGGFRGFLDIASGAEKFRLLDFRLEFGEPVFWVALLGGLLLNLASYTSDQCVVQRYMTTSDEAGAARSIRLNSVLSFVNCGLFFLLGTALYTYYASHPAHLDVTLLQNDSILPVFIADELPIGIAGLIFASMAAATMSTLAANLNSSATAVTKDFYLRLLPAASGRNQVRCGQAMTVVFGMLGMGGALVLANMRMFSLYEQFQRYLGILTGGVACLFFMGIFLPRVNGSGALVGLFANYCVCFALDRIPWAHKPHFLLHGVFGMAVCLLVATLASPFFPSAGRKNLKGLCWRERGF